MSILMKNILFSVGGLLSAAALIWIAVGIVKHWWVHRSFKGWNKVGARPILMLLIGCGNLCILLGQLSRGIPEQTGVRYGMAAQAFLVIYFLMNAWLLMRRGRG